MSLLPSWNDLKSRASQFLQKDLIQPAKNFVQNDVVNPVQRYFQPTDTVRVRDFARELPGAAFSVGSDIVHAIPRFTGNTIATFSNKTLNPSDIPYAGKAIFGSEPLKPYPQIGTENAQKYFGSKNPFLGGALALGSIGLDASNAFVPGDATVGKIAASRSAEEIANLLKGRVADAVLPSLAKHLVTVNKPEEVSTLIQAARKIAMPHINPEIKPIAPEPNASELIKTPGVTSAPESAIQIARRPQELNVNNLNLTNSEKQIMSEAGRNQNTTTMSNKSVIEAAKRANPLESPITMGQTLDATAQGLATRQAAVSEMKAFSALQRSGASEEELKTAFLSVANKSKIAASFGTDAGRTLQAQKILADEFNSPMQKVLKLLDTAGVDPEKYALDGSKVDFNNPGQVVDFYRKYVPAKFSDWLDVIRYNSMLSSPLTQAVNITSNLTAGSTVRPIVKTLTGGVDFIRSALTGTPQEQFAGEGLAHAKGYWGNVSNGWRKFVDTMKGTQDIENFDLAHIPLSPGSKTESVLSYPMKLLEGMDQFFMAMGRGGEEAALKYRMLKGGAVGDLKTAVDTAARETVFRGDLMAKGQGHFLNALDFIPTKILEARNHSNPLLRWATKMTVPFLQTPTNILKQGFEYTPGFGAATLWGNANKSEQIAKQIFGASVFLGASSMLGSGRMTLGEPTNQTQKNEFRAAGMQPYSVKIGDTWIQYSKLHPAIAFPLYLTAVLNDNKENGNITDDGIDKIMNTIAKYGTFFSDQSYMKSMGGFLDAAKGGESAIQQLVSNYWQQAVPFRALSGWVARMIDDVQRKVDPKATFLEKQAQLLMLNIPGASFLVPPRLDQMGNPVQSQHNIINSISPMKISTENPQMKDFYDTHQDILKKNRLNQQIKDMLNRGETPPQALVDQASSQAPVGSDIQAINGQFYVKLGKRGYVGFDSSQEAAIARNKEVFQGSGKPIDIIDGMVYRRDKNGNAVAPIQETDYKERLYEAMQTEAYANDDISSWINVAKERFQNLESQLQDPNLDPLDAITIQNKINSLVKKYAKYRKYGGFKAPKRPRKAKLSFRNPLSSSSSRISSAPTFKGPTLRPIRLTVPGASNKQGMYAPVRPPGL